MNKQDFKAYEVKGTPFTIIELSEDKENLQKGFHIVIGNHRATDRIFNTRQEAVRFINRTAWDLVGSLLQAFQELKEKEDKL